mgnify:CR=1 FL=1
MKQYTKDWLEELCASSYSYAEVLRKAGRKTWWRNNQDFKTENRGI